METRKIIRFLILIFAFLTVFFVYLYLEEYNNKNVLSDELVSSTIENLEKKGIKLDENAVERTVPEMDIYDFEHMSHENYYESISSGLIDAVFGDSVIKLSFDVPNGASFGVYDVEDSSKELARIVFSNNDLTFIFQKNSVNVSGASDPVFGGNVDGINDEIRKNVDSLANSVLPKNISYRICGVSGEDRLLVVSVIEMVDGYDINNAYLNFVFKENELVKVVGNLVPVSPKAVYHEQLIDGVNALYRLDLDSVYEIYSQRMVYSMRKSDSDKSFLVPGWEVEYRDNLGVDRKIFVDAL